MRENAKIGDLIFSAKNTSSNHDPADDESYDLVASHDISMIAYLGPQGRGFAMRRLLSLLACACLVSMLAGCHWFHWHGVCDCEFDDYCSSRSPWVRQGGAITPISPSSEYVSPAPIGGGELIPAPLPAKLPDTKLPDAKKGKL